MSNFDPGGGGGGNRYETYPQQNADGSISEVTYDRETGQYSERVVVPPPPRESPDDVNMPYGGVPAAQGIGVNWGDQPGERAPGGGGRPWWHFWKPGESPDTEPPGRGAGLASPPMSPPVPTNDYLGEGGYTPPPADPFNFPRDQWTPSNQAAPSGPAGSANLRTERPMRYDFQVQRKSDVPSPAFNPVYDSQRNPTDPYYNPRGVSGNSDQFTPDMLPFYPSRPQAGTSSAPPRAGGGGGPSDQTPPEHLPFYPAPGGTNQRYGLPPAQPGSSSSGSAGGGGGGGMERPAGWSAADAQWEQEFRYMHQGMGPAEFYKQPNNWKDPQFYAKYNRYPTDAEAMAWALADRQWGDALFRERGFAPTFSDWMQNYSAARSQGYPVRPYPGMANQYRGGGGDLMAYSGGGGAPARPAGGGHWVEGPNGIPVWQD